MGTLPYTHIIWDWNGTLFNDTWLCLDIFNAMLRAHGLPETTLECHRNEFDFPVQRYYERKGLVASDADFVKAANEFMSVYEQRRLECALHEGVMDTLKAFAKAGCKLSVFSAYKEDTLRQLLDYYGLSNYLCAVTGQTHIRASGKLDRVQAHLEKIAESNGRWLMVGDSPHDREAAQALGADSILLCHGHFPKHRLKPLGVPVYDSLHALRIAMGL